MNVDIKDFVGVFENAIPDHICDDVIKTYEFLVANGFGISRQQLDRVSKLQKDNISVFLNNTQTYYLSDFQHLPAIMNILWDKCYIEYIKKYAILDEPTAKGLYTNKVQKTEIGQGYHMWHFESSNRECSNRYMLYIIYLNDVEEGGETEFLYYPRRIKPKKGTVVFIPGGFTHTHRGNPPISNEKYIATGWFEY